MLDAILGSKLYKASPRKEKIVAAYKNPINHELVKQLASALDDNYKEELVKDIKEDEAERDAKQAKEQQMKEANRLEFEPTSNLDAPKPRASRSELDSHLGPDFDEPKDNDLDSSVPDMSDTSNNGPEENVANSSTYIRNKQRVVASLVRNEKITAQQLADEVKGLLNLKDTTMGVSRTDVKDKELWIYYNDNTNLNNIMAEVIETLSASDYNFLTFNRLARTDNAIVFEISVDGGNYDQSTITQG